MLISEGKFSIRDYHIQMGREAAQRCIDRNGDTELFPSYCPLNLKNDKAGKKNEAEFRIGWDEAWAKHNEKG